MTNHSSTRFPTGTFTANTRLFLRPLRFCFLLALFCAGANGHADLIYSISLNGGAWTGFSDSQDIGALDGGTHWNHIGTSADWTGDIKNNTGALVSGFTYDLTIDQQWGNGAANSSVNGNIQRQGAGSDNGANNFVNNLIVFENTAALFGAGQSFDVLFYFANRGSDSTTV